MNPNWSTGTTWWRLMSATTELKVADLFSDQSLFSNQRCPSATGFPTGRWFTGQRAWQILESANLLVKTALVPRCLVFVYQSLTSHAVEHWHSCSVCIRCCSFVTGGNCADHAFDMSAHHRTHTGMTGTSGFCLSRTFFSLGGVRQVSLLNQLVEQLEIEQSSIVAVYPVVNCAAVTKNGSGDR